jgi:hypothetical protein
MLAVCIMEFVCFSMQTVTIPMNSVNQLIFAMVKYGVFFEVWAQFLNNIQMSFSLKGSIWISEKKKMYGHKLDLTDPGYGPMMSFF